MPYKPESTDEMNKKSSKVADAISIALLIIEFGAGLVLLFLDLYHVIDWDLFYCFLVMFFIPIVILLLIVVFIVGAAIFGIIYLSYDIIKESITHFITERKIEKCNKKLMEQAQKSSNSNKDTD